MRSIILILFLCVLLMVKYSEETKRTNNREWRNNYRTKLPERRVYQSTRTQTKRVVKGVVTPQCPEGTSSNQNVKPTSKSNKRGRKGRNKRIPKRGNKNNGCRTPSQRIRESYDEARWIQKPMLYAFSTDEAEKFVSRFDEDLAPPISRECSEQKTKISKKDIRDIYRIMKSMQCSASPQNNINNKSRKRRETSPQIIQNPNGSVTRIRNCVRRNVVTNKGYVRLCSQCHAVTELPRNMYPRFINEVICEPLDTSCLTGGGVCTEGTLKIPFLKDVNNVGESRLSEWVKYDQPIRTSCNCGVRQDSVFRYFV